MTPLDRPARRGARRHRRRRSARCSSRGTLADARLLFVAGLVVGVACAALAQRRGARPVRARTRARLDHAARGALPVYAEGVGARARRRCRCSSPPIALLALAFLAWLLLGGRRRAGEKYAGLRILR